MVFIWNTLNKNQTTIKDISNESLWLNKHITIDNKIIYWKKWEKAGIHRIGDIVNSNNVPLTHNEIVNKYNLKITFVDLLQLQNSIPTNWFITIKNTHKVSNLNEITINSTIKKIQKKLQRLLLDIINHSPHISKSSSYWHIIFPLFPAINNDFWKNIYQSPFNIVRETRLQNHT